MENNKTISYLNSKIWYRSLKVIFLLLLSIVILLVNVVILDDGIFGIIFLDILTGNILILIFFEVLRRVFYYIVLGKIIPKK